MASTPQTVYATGEAHEQMQRCIELCRDCHGVCLRTLAYCIAQGGRHVEEKHLRLLMDCAQICHTAADFMLRGSSFIERVCGVCADVCESCSDSCDSFGNDAQMRECADVCDECATVCRAMSVAGAA